MKIIRTTTFKVLFGIILVIIASFLDQNMLIVPIMIITGSWISIYYSVSWLEKKYGN